MTNVQYCLTCECIRAVEYDNAGHMVCIVCDTALTLDVDDTNVFDTLYGAIVEEMVLGGRDE